MSTNTQPSNSNPGSKTSTKKTGAFNKYRGLLVAITLFLIFNLSVLALNFYTSSTLNNDAVSINLSGRQRMLSQRTTKVLLAIQVDAAQGQYNSKNNEELTKVVSLFDGTLNGFKNGGMVIGGDDKPVELKQLTDVNAIKSVDEALGIWQPYKQLLAPVMPSGYAYGKSIRTVKTCVGSEFCRFGTQNSTQLGIDIEKAFDHMWAPHKVKFAVSGCPRNCAESGIKDVGVIGVDSGWEIYVGGNGGIKTEVAHFLTKVKTAEEVIEYSGAFIQIYREEARYLDRTVHWIERVGLDYVKKRVLEDAEGRKAAYERLLYALQGAVDPWADRVEKRAEHKEFETITV